MVDRRYAFVRVRRMLRYLKDEQRYLLIAGFFSQIGIEVEKMFERIQMRDLAAQVFDADSVAGWQHVYYAAINAISAFHARTNITRDLPMEILLYVSGQDQIGKAVQLVGISDATQRVCLVILARSETEATDFQERFQRQFELTREDSALEIKDERKLRHLMEVFSVSETEIEVETRGGLSREEALRGLIIERGALLVAKR